MVNNPLNRIVNLSDMLAPASTQAAVKISVPASDTDTDTARVAITGDSLAEAIAASVAAWVIQRSAHTASASASANSSSSVLVDLTEACDENSIVRLLLDHPITLEGQCVEHSLAMNTIEGVPALRHWFVRNQWNTVVQAQGGAACEGPEFTTTQCTLVFPLVVRKAMRDSGVITLLWSRS